MPPTRKRRRELLRGRRPAGAGGPDL